MSKRITTKLFKRIRIIILCSFFWITKNFICSLYFLKLLLITSLIRMVFTRKFTIGFFDIFLIGDFADFSSTLASRELNTRKSFQWRNWKKISWTFPLEKTLKSFQRRNRKKISWTIPPKKSYNIKKVNAKPKIEIFFPEKVHTFKN